MSKKHTTDEAFVAFGPQEARKGRKAGGLPEPPVVTEIPPDAGPIRRLLAWLTSGSGDDRKLWARRGARDS